MLTFIITFYSQECSGTALVTVSTATSATNTEKNKNQDIALQSILGNSPNIRANLTDIYPFEFTPKKDETQPSSFSVGDSVIVRRTENFHSSSKKGKPASTPYLPSSFTVSNGYYLPCTYVLTAQMDEVDLQYIEMFHFM